MEHMQEVVVVVVAVYKPVMLTDLTHDIGILTAHMIHE